ncbi:hypothetical protein SUGI_1170810 [Cryptomeria japonica]|nr:hypothetical protein SUGI_1170810 [Cryptomeria japonica]
MAASNSQIPTPINSKLHQKHSRSWPPDSLQAFTPHTNQTVVPYTIKLTPLCCHAITDDAQLKKNAANARYLPFVFVTLPMPMVFNLGGKQALLRGWEDTNGVKSPSRSASKSGIGYGSYVNDNYSSCALRIVGISI